MKKPRPHQKTAISAVVKGFKSHDRGKLIMACGTGKTLIANWVREAMKVGCTLLMAPSNELLAQTLQAWRENSKVPFKALAICCDATVANGRDEIDTPAANVGADVTTDYKEIAKFISGAGCRVVLCTYQSSEALALAMGLVHVPEFDLAIADEAHRTTGGADHLFPSITHADKIRASKRLFMTATPRFYFDNGLNEIVSMDNEKIYGPLFFELNFAEAIKQKLLTDYEILVVGISPEAEKEAEQLIKKNPRLKVADRKLTARDLAVNIAILRTIKDRKLERVITFHSTCPKASAAADFLPLLQNWMPKKHRTDIKLWARTVNHTVNIGDRHELMRQFVALEGPGVLTNARCLGEGVDVPTVDAIAFMDPKKSKIDIAQSVGRAIRLSPGKKKSYIILPVIILPGDDPEQINSKSFKPVFDVVNALRAHDSTLMEQLQYWKDSVSNGVPGNGAVEDDERRKITFNIPDDCNKKIAEWFVCRVIKQGQWTNWRGKVTALSELAKMPGHGTGLRRWCYETRKGERNGTLSAQIKNALYAEVPWWKSFMESRRGQIPIVTVFPEAVEFFNKYGRLPDGNRDGEIGRRFGALRHRLIHNKLDKKISEQIYAAFPTLKVMSRPERWKAGYKAAIEFFNNSSAIAVPSTIKAWITGQKRYPLSPENRMAYREVLAARELWNQRDDLDSKKAFVQFIQVNGGRPRPPHPLAIWFNEVKHKDAAAKVCPREWLNKMKKVKRVSNAKKLSKYQLARMFEATKWCEVHNYGPKLKSRLGRFIKQLVKGFGDLEEVKKWDKQIKTYQTYGDKVLKEQLAYKVTELGDLQKENMRQISEWCKLHGHRPASETLLGSRIESYTAKYMHIPAFVTWKQSLQKYPTFQQAKQARRLNLDY